MTSSSLSALQVVAGRKPELPDQFYNTDIIAVPGGGLLLMMEKYAENAQAHRQTRLVSYHAGAWSLVRDFKKVEFRKGCLTLLQDETVMVTSVEGEIATLSGNDVTPFVESDPITNKVFCIDGQVYALDGSGYIE